MKRAFAGLVLCALVALAVACGASPGVEAPDATAETTDAADAAEIPGTDAETGPLDLAVADETTVEETTSELPGPEVLDAPPDLAPRPDAIGADADPDALPLSPLDPAPDVTIPGGVTLRVGTMNVYSAQRGTPEAIGVALAALQLDVVGLEECAAALGAQIAAAAGYEYVVGDGDMLLSHTPLDSFRVVSLDAERSVGNALTVIEGVTFSVYVAHISWQVAGVKDAQTIVDDVVAKDPVPHFVMLGDFNDEHYSPQNTVMEQVLTDAATAMGWHPEQRISWPSDGFDETEGSQLIDLIWFRKAFPAIVLSADVINLSPTLSDHKPAIAELRFPKDPATPFGADPFAASRDAFAALPSPADRPPNLLVNPGAESGLDGWTVGGGAMAVASRDHQVPRTGAAFFTGYPVQTDPAAPWSWGAQDVDVSAHAAAIDEGRGVAYASAWVATGYQVEEKDGLVADIPKGYDDGELIVESLDVAHAVLDRVASGRRDPLKYDPWAAAVDLPPGTRSVRLTWMSHNKTLNGMSNDVAFDDLYLGVGEQATPHRALAGNRLANAGGEAGGLSGWTADPAWVAQPDLQAWGPWGLDLFPPWAWSGRGGFYAGTDAVNGGPAPGNVTLAQAVDLGPWGAAIDAGTVDVRWGGHVRTYHARVGARIELEVLDADGTTWHVFASDEIRAAEWTEVRGRTRIPAGASGVRLVVRAMLDRADDGVFADELYVVPERLGSDPNY